MKKTFLLLLITLLAPAAWAQKNPSRKDLDAGEESNKSKVTKGDTLAVQCGKGLQCSLSAGVLNITLISSGSSASPTPAVGPDTAVQFNDGGILDGDQNFTFDEHNRTGYLHLGPLESTLTPTLQSYVLPSFLITDTAFTTALGIEGQSDLSNTGFNYWGIYSVVAGMPSQDAVDRSVLSIEADAYTAGTHSLNSVVGLRTYASHLSTGSASNLIGIDVYSNAKDPSAGPITSNYGLRIQAQNGVAGKNYGIYVADHGNGANDEALHVEGGKSVFKGPVILGSASQCQILTGAGSPEGVVAAPVCSLYLRTDGSVGLTLYVKEFGSGSTGWAAK